MTKLLPTPEMIEAGIVASHLRPRDMYPRYTEQELRGIVKRVYEAMEGARDLLQGTPMCETPSQPLTVHTGELLPRVPPGES